MTRKEKAVQTKDRLYASALQLINDKGYENVLIDDITSNAGFAKGSFYNHFQSKEQLIFSTSQLTDQIYASAYEEAKKKTDFYEMLDAFITLSYSQVEKLGKEVIRAICVYISSEESKKIYSNKDRHLYSSLTGIIDYGKECGVIGKRHETDHCVEKIIIMLIGVDCYWSSIEAMKSLTELAGESIKILIKGFV